MSREGKLAKNTIILGFGTIFSKIAVYITLPVLTACLTKEDYGTYDLIVTLVSLLLPAVTLQIQSAAFRFLMDLKDGDEAGKTSIISNIYGFVLITSVIALAIMFFILSERNFISRIIICGYFLCDIFSNVNKQIMRGFHNNFAYAISALVGAIGQIILILFLILGLKQELIGTVFALGFAEFMSAGYLFFTGKLYKYISVRELNIAKIKALLAYSWPMVPNSLSQWVMHLSDRLVITFFMGVSANAIYSVANKIPSILIFAQTTFTLAWQENAISTARDEDVAEYYSSMFRIFFDIVAGGMALLIAITPILYKIFIHGDYGEAYRQIQILYMATFFFCLSSFWGGIFVAFQKTKAVATTTVIAALSNIIIDMATIQWIGLFAASISTLVSYILLCILRAKKTQKIIKLKYDIPHCILILIIMVIICLISYQQILVLDILNFFICVVVGLYLNKKLISDIIKKVKGLLFGENFN